MAIQFVTDSGNLVIPGAYPKVTVQKSNSGVATTGVITLVGEADAGPDYSLEADLTSNWFGPDELGAVVAKYKTGNLVDAYRSAVAAANDPDIVGAPSRIYLIKTNVSAKASRAMGSYSTLEDQSYGAMGNLIYFSVTASQAEVAPVVGPFVLAFSTTGSTLGLRVNGGTVGSAVAGTTNPSALVTSLNSLANLMATGGVAFDWSTGLSGFNETVSVNGNNITITVSGGQFHGIVPVGSLLIIPANGDNGAGGNSPIIGAASANRGSYVVTASDLTTITAKKVRDATSTVITVPVTVGSVSGVGPADFYVFTAVTLKNMSGTDRGLLSATRVSDASTLAVAVNGTTITATISTAWAVTPSVGDILFIPSGSAIVGAGSANIGYYTVTASTNTTVVATRLSDGNPIAVSATDIAAVTDLQARRPAINGTGKSLEIFDNAGTTDIGGRLFDTVGAALKVSTALSPYVYGSSAEYIASLNVNRQSDHISEVILAGGNVALKIGYFGTSGTLTVSADGTLSTTVVGGLGVNLSGIKLSAYTTLADLAIYINAQTGYSAAVFTARAGQLPGTILDVGTYNIGGQFSGSQTGLIKYDAYSFTKAVANTSSLVQVHTAPTSGLPEVQGVGFMAGGSKGGSTSTGVQAAIDALTAIRTNFVVPLFSRDATADITDGLTESTSTYVIDGINAGLKTHVIAMSQLKRRRYRQGFASKRDSFTAVKLAANNLAAARMTLTFQDFKAVASDGSIKQYQPWMGAVLAAGMQAAGFYRAIFNKGINCTGIIQAAGDFRDLDDSQVEDALLNGLLVARRPEAGGFRWVSDQTTYGTDDNFVYNSIQAIYAADVVALSTAQRMENAFVGQSPADVSAASALAFFEGIMADMKRLKLIAASDDAPKGFRNAVIAISGPVMQVSVEIKLAGAIYFIPISFLVTQVQQTAAA